MLSLPRGTRDYSPEEAIFINAMLEKTENVFRRFGFSPLFTPAIETNAVLNAKSNYGEEFAKEIFSIEGEDSSLRYDFTVPLSRYVAMNKDLSLPFKRYQIGQIWRKDEPQFMRQREFIQADVDIVGSKEVESDAEVVAACATALDEIGLEDYTMHVNSRVLLENALLMFKIPQDKKRGVLTALDKLYKIGSDQVLSILVKDLGIEEKAANSIISFISSGDINEKFDALSAFSPQAKEEIKKWERLEDLVSSYGAKGELRFDLSLVRGFDYYTGFIWEFAVEKEGKRLPSVVGGGRYNQLIGKFLKTDTPLPATGASIGISRLFEILYQKTNIKTYADVFIANVGPEDYEFALKACNELRASGINVDINVSQRGLSKQLDYAASLGIPFVLIVGEQERKQGKLRLRDMSDGTEELLDIDGAIEKLKQ
ncbi:MAG: histidine--tRNA ligase [Candidatus Micrarchaeia archaeon]